MSKTFIICLIMVFVLSGNIGCQKELPTKQDVQPSETVTITKNDMTDKTSVLKVASWDDIQQRVAQHRGKIVVVNIWLMTCESCLEEFPHFLELQKRYGKKNLVCLTLNGDYDGVKEKPPEYYKANIEKFLAQQTLPAEHYLLNLPFLNFMELVDLESTPAIICL